MNARVPKGVPTGGQFATTARPETEVALDEQNMPPLAHAPFRFVTAPDATDKVEIVVPPGEYVVGDPCYVVPDDQWDDLLATNGVFGADHFSGDRSPVGWIRGQQDGSEVAYQVIGLQTQYGDGCYGGSDGRDYPVDAGLIGLVPLAACDPDDVARQTRIPNNSLTLVRFDKPTTVTRSADGTLSFGSISIATGDVEDDFEPCPTCRLNEASWSGGECDDCSSSCEECYSNPPDYDGRICAVCADELDED